MPIYFGTGGSPASVHALLTRLNNELVRCVPPEWGTRHFSLAAPAACALIQNQIHIDAYNNVRLSDFPDVLARAPWSRPLQPLKDDEIHVARIVVGGEAHRNFAAMIVLGAQYYAWQFKDLLRRSGFRTEPRDELENAVARGLTFVANQTGNYLHAP